METAATDGPIAGSTSPDATVRVVIRVGCTPQRAWSVLTRPDEVSRWFGNLTVPFEVGVPTRLEFGDGDFFAITPLEVEPPRRLEYAWRFLGTGPEDTIHWCLRGTGSLTEVEVRDRQRGRTRSAARELLEGWLDFSRRLLGFVESGEPTRYDWRRDFDGSIELDASAERAFEILLSKPAQARWLLPSTSAPEGGLLSVGDGEDPDPLRLTELGSASPLGRTFGIETPTWAAPTRLHVEVVPRGEAESLLVVSHTGWAGVSRDPEECRRQRERFCSFWIGALHAARDAVLEFEPSASTVL